MTTFNSATYGDLVVWAKIVDRLLTLDPKWILGRSIHNAILNSGSEYLWMNASMQQAVAELADWFIGENR